MASKHQKIAITAVTIVVATGVSYAAFMLYQNSVGSNNPAHTVTKNSSVPNTIANNTSPLSLENGISTSNESLHTYTIMVDEHIDKDVIFGEKTKTDFKLKLTKADSDTPTGLYRGTIEIKHYINFEGDQDFQAPNAKIEGGMHILYAGEIEGVVMTTTDYLKEAQNKIDQEGDFKPEPLVHPQDDFPIEPLTPPDDAMAIPEPLVKNYDFRGEGKWLLPLDVKYDAKITVPEYSTSTSMNKDGKQVFPFQILIMGDTVQIFVSKPETIYTFKTTLKKD